MLSWSAICRTSHSPCPSGLGHGGGLSPVPSARLSGRAAPASKIWHRSARLGADDQLPGACAVPHGVGGQFVNRDHHVADAVFGQPGPGDVREDGGPQLVQCVRVEPLIKQKTGSCRVPAGPGRIGQRGLSRHRHRPGRHKAVSGGYGRSRRWPIPPLRRQRRRREDTGPSGRFRIRYTSRSKVPTAAPPSMAQLGPVRRLAASALAVSTSGKIGILALIPASWIVRERTAPGDTTMLTGMCSLA